MGGFYLDAVGRLLLAVLIGGVIGYEREHKNRPAGLRTHVLVCVGAALVMVTSEYMSLRFMNDVDVARLGAQVISGIGFLGAGTIIRHGNNVKGLTTAASLWAVACVGLAAGIGFYLGAIVAAVIIYITLNLLKKVEFDIISRNRQVFVEINDRPGIFSDINSVLERHEAIVKHVDFVNYGGGGKDTTLRYDLKVDPKQKYEVLIDELKQIDGVVKVYKRNIDKSKIIS